MQVESASPEELLQRFIDRYLLQPHSASALRARFQLPEAPAYLNAHTHVRNVGLARRPIPSLRPW
jgi:hypothetical protein